MDTFPLSSVHQHIDPLSSEIIYLQGNMPAFEKLILGYGRTVEGLGKFCPRIQASGFSSWVMDMGLASSVDSTAVTGP